MNSEEMSKLKRAGKIAVQVREYAKSIAKPGAKCLNIAEKIENRIIDLGAKPAFPVTLCMNEISAHSTPTMNDETKISGLLKIDFGVVIDGIAVDTAFSIDLEGNEENKKLILASEEALKNAIEAAKDGKSLGEIGKSIQDAIESRGFSPIRNLSGHEIKEYDLHAGATIPNYDNKNERVLSDGIYAIEPFATSGVGEVYDSKDSGIYMLKSRKAIRDNSSREILSFIEKEYSTLPFCSRWIAKKFGSRALISLKLLEQANILHHFKQLVEKSHKPVAQSEHTILISNGKVEVVS